MATFTSGWRGVAASAFLSLALAGAGAAEASSHGQGASVGAALSLVSATTTSPQKPGYVEVIVDVSEQSMDVIVDGAPHATWDVSTGRRVHWTPTGEFNVAFLSPRHRSSRYNNAPMPHSIFFNGNIAIHGTTDIKRLGQRASHGCVRLHPDHAKELFGLVKTVGKQRTAIRVID